MLSIVSNTKEPATLTGKISAHPNPVPFGKDCVLISWETNDPAGVEVRRAALAEAVAEARAFLEAVPLAQG